MKQFIDPFSITVLRGRSEIAVAHDLNRKVAVEALPDGSIAFNGPAGTSWTAYENNGGSPLVKVPDIEFCRVDEN